MKNVLLTFSIAFILLSSGAASAQILTQNGSDTSKGCYTSGTSFEVDNHIKSGSVNPVYLKWNIIASATKFDAGWDIVGSGFCDNVNCYTALSASNNLFNNNAVYKSDGYDNTTFNGTQHDFHMLFAVSNPAVGSSAVVRVNAYDTVGKTTRTLTFIGMKCSSAAGITTINSSDDVVLYPNPVRGEAVNVLYDEKAGVKTIAVFNMIGKLMGPIYKPSSNGSAKIDVDDMPTGIYFLRLLDGQGHVVATRRFTRQ